MLLNRCSRVGKSGVFVPIIDFIAHGEDAIAPIIISVNKAMSAEAGFWKV
jgi:hypothetical protein